MLYLNQLDYPHVRYEHNVEHGGVPIERQKVSTSGCGLCSVCMVVDHLTTHHLSIEDCVQLSYESGANIIVGTRLCYLGPAAAEKFGMDYRPSSDINEVLAHLQAGGEVVINVGGSHDDYVGLYSKGGHYIVAIAAINGIDLTALMLEKDKKASAKYNHDINLETFIANREK